MPVFLQILFFSSLVLYVLACYFPAFLGVEEHSKFNQPGILVLFLGLFSVFYTWDSFLAWASNAFYFACILLIFIFPDYQIIGLVFSIIAFSLGFFTFNIHTMMVNEAGHTTEVKRGSGFWLWMASYGIMMIRMAVEIVF